MKGATGEKPARILLVVAESAAAGRRAARADLGLGAAVALDRVRIVTDVRGLRGWRHGTLVTVIWPENLPLDREIERALDVYLATGRLKRARVVDIADLNAEVVG